MLKKYSISFFVAVVLILPVTLFAIVRGIEISYNALPVYKGESYTNTSFTNQNGNKVLLKDWKNKIVVANFFFTHCTSVCPKMMKNVKEVQEAYAGQQDIQFNSFSVDPARDSVKRLDVYAKQFGIGNNWNLLTGNKSAIYRLARKSFSLVANDGDGGSTDFIHSDKLVLLDKQQRIRGYYSGTSDTEVQQLINDIKKLKNED